MLRRWDHAHVHILLVGSLNLLLLLLKQFDLLLDRKLFHCLGIALAVGNSRDGWEAGALMTTDSPDSVNKDQDNLLPGEENMLIKGVSSEGLRL